VLLSDQPSRLSFPDRTPRTAASSGPPIAPNSMIPISVFGDLCDERGELFLTDKELSAAWCGSVNIALGNAHDLVDRSGVHARDC
jgi:hypothetical protein